MNRHEIWLAGFTILSIISHHRSSQFTYADDCETDHSVDNLITLNCSLLNPTRYFTSVFPSSKEEKESIEVIYFVPIVPHGPNTINLIGVSYNELPNLKRILIRNNIIIRTNLAPPYDFQHLYTVVHKSKVEKMFDECDNLEILEITNSSFFEVIQFRLPEKLKIYNIAENKYRVLKIAGSEELIEVNANSNPLNNVPLFSNPVPPVRTLRLKECPLGDMTLLDLAPLCELTLLELKLPPEHSYMNSNGYCNCTMLQQYAKEYSLEINSVKCYEPKSTEKISCPVSEYLDKARLIRQKCPFKKNAFSAMATTILKYVFLSTILLMLLAVAILYAIRHYHLREWWRENRFGMSSGPTSIHLEENEESIRTESSREGSL